MIYDASNLELSARDHAFLVRSPHWQCGSGLDDPGWISADERQHLLVRWDGKGKVCGLAIGATFNGECRAAIIPPSDPNWQALADRVLAAEMASGRAYIRACSPDPI